MSGPVRSSIPMRPPSTAPISKRPSLPDPLKRHGHPSEAWTNGGLSKGTHLTKGRSNGSSKEPGGGKQRTAFGREEPERGTDKPRLVRRDLFEERDERRLVEGNPYEENNQLFHEKGNGSEGEDNRESGARRRSEESSEMRLVGNHPSEENDESRLAGGPLSRKTSNRGCIQGTHYGHRDMIVRRNEALDANRSTMVGGMDPPGPDEQVGLVEAASGGERGAGRPASAPPA